MLTIQKLISLLEPRHLQEFKHHLQGTGNTLPLRLIETLEKSGPLKPESDELCVAVYGDTEEKTRRKFFQLAHYTFRLTSFLARRYPFYLTHNISAIGHKLNSGHQEQALLDADNLLDIAIKTEDFATQTWVLKFLINFSNIREKRKEAIRQQQLLNEALHNEATVNEIQLYIREHLNFKDKKNLTTALSKKHLAFFSQFHQHPCFSARVMSRYGSLYTLNFLEDTHFYAPESRKELDDLADEIEKHNYVIFPFADDILLNIDYLQLKHTMREMNEEEIVKEATRITRKWNTLRFWQNHINTAQIVSLSIQASYFITHYCICYKENYREQIPSHVRDNIDETVSICQKLIEQLKEEKDAHVRFINLNNIHCMLLLLCGKDKIKESVDKLEAIMINYQQIPFQKLYDAIFANLIIGYFSLNDHTGVSECYRRYEKLTAHRAKVEENDITIKAFYYVSQWQQTGRDQYVEKVKGLLQDVSEKPALASTLKLIEDLCNYFKVPVYA